LPENPLIFPKKNRKIIRRDGDVFLPIYNAYGIDYRLQTIFILLIKMFLLLNLMTLGIAPRY